MGTGLENVFQSASNRKRKKNWTNSFQTAMFSSSYEQANSKERFYRNFAFAFPTLFECRKYVQEKKLNTVATEASRCFLLINGLFDETQMHGTNNVHLF